MGAALVVVSVSVVIVLMVTAVFTLVWRRPLRDETPEERYRRTAATIRRSRIEAARDADRRGSWQPYGGETVAGSGG